MQTKNYDKYNTQDFLPRKIQIWHLYIKTDNRQQRLHQHTFRQATQPVQKPRFSFKWKLTADALQSNFLSCRSGYTEDSYMSFHRGDPYGCGYRRFSFGIKRLSYGFEKILPTVQEILLKVQKNLLTLISSNCRTYVDADIVLLCWIFSYTRFYLEIYGVLSKAHRKKKKQVTHCTMRISTN